MKVIDVYTLDTAEGGCATQFLFSEHKLRSRWIGTRAHSLPVIQSQIMHPH